MFRYHLLSFTIGFLLDQIIGDPHFMPHPVRAIGALISFMEKKLRNNDREYTKEALLAKGTLLCVVVIASTALVTWLVLAAFYLLSPYAGVAAEAVLTCYILAAKSLKTESMKVYKALEGNAGNESPAGASDNERIERAKKELSMIVGRDTDCLDEAGIIRAAVETVAENTSDGVIAPMIYTFLGGPVLGLTYKAVNTMDSMMGYHNDKYEYFGRTAAKLDDIVNFIPARISALLMIMAACLGGKDYSFAGAVRIFRRDRFRHKSPNSAQTESVCAGALSIRLAGDAVYFGKVVKKPFIGDDIRHVETKDIKRACFLMTCTAYICMAIFVLIGLLIVFLI